MNFFIQNFYGHKIAYDSSDLHVHHRYLTSEYQKQTLEHKKLHDFIGLQSIKRETSNQAYRYLEKTAPPFELRTEPMTVNFKTFFL